MRSSATGRDAALWPAYGSPADLVLEGYGLTEATCARVRSFFHGRSDGSVGQRMPCQDVRAVDDRWDDVPTGSVRRLLVSGRIPAGRGVAVCLAATGIAKVLALEPMVERAHHVRFPVPAFRLIGAAELAGATGLVVGERHPRIGAAAAVSLCTAMVGACAVHLRIGDRWPAAAPAAIIGAATAYTAAGFVARVRHR